MHRDLSPAAEHPLADDVSAASDKTADAFERAVQADARRRRAVWLAGAAIEAIASAPPPKRRRRRGRRERDEPEPIDPATDWSFAHGCGPAPEAFGETHCGFTPVETTLARRVARARRDLRGFAEACDAGRVPADCIESLATVATSGTIALWRALAANDPKDCRARLRVARAGESPDLANGADARVTWGVVSGGRFRCARTLRLTPLQQRDIWRARFLLSRKIKQTTSVGDAFAELVRRLDAELRRRGGRRLHGVDDLRPGRVVLIDPERRVPWIQTNRGRFRLRWRDLPRRRRGRRPDGRRRWRNVRAIALAPSGAPLAAALDALGAAYPALVTSDLEALGTREATAAEGRDSQLSTLNSRLHEVERLAGPDPAAALAAVGLDARQLPASWNPEHHRAAAAASGRFANAERCEQILAAADLADEIAARTRSGADADRLRARLGWNLRAWKDAVQLGRRLRAQPALCAAFRAGAPYARVRAIARRPVPAHDAAWARVARRFPTQLVEALVAVAEPGARPPETPPGYEPIRPVGSAIAEPCFVTLSTNDAQALARVAAAIERVTGAPLGPEELVAAAAGLWLRWFDSAIGADLVIYLASPESRLATPAERLAPRLQRVAPGDVRLHAAFGYLRRLQADRRISATSDAPAPPGGKLGKTARDISTEIRRAVVARDGERCITPGCGRDLTTEHDHNQAVGDGGWPDARYDRRLCKACNLAKAAGRLRVIALDDGTSIVADHWWRVIGTVELGVSWDGPVADWVARSVAATAAARLEDARSTYQARAQALGASMVRESRTIWTTRGSAHGRSPRGDPIAAITGG